MNAEAESDHGSVRIVGEGTYGLVVDVGNGRVRKMFKQHLGHDGTILIELAMMASLRDEFKPKLFEIEEADRRVALTMEDCGTNLMECGLLFSQQAKLDMLPKLLWQAIRALLWLQQHGVVHMDIKPQNICVDFAADDRLRLVDFGFCVMAAAGLTRRREGVTVSFADPRLVRCKDREQPGVQVDFACDMYSMGISIASFLATKRMAPSIFNCFTVFDSCSAPNAGSLINWRCLVREPRLLAVLGRMTELDHSKRATAAELLDMDAFKARLVNEIQTPTSLSPLVDKLQQHQAHSSADHDWYRACEQKCKAAIAPKTDISTVPSVSIHCNIASVVAYRAIGDILGHFGEYFTVWGMTLYRRYLDCVAEIVPINNPTRLVQYLLPAALAVCELVLLLVETPVTHRVDVYRGFIQSPYMRQHKLVASAELSLWVQISDVYAIHTEALKIARALEFKLFVLE